MTRTDPALSDNLPSEGAIMLKRAGIAVVGGIALIFMAGMMAGFISAVLDKGSMSAKGAAIFAAMVLVAGAIAYAMWRFWPRMERVPEAPRVKEARRLLYLSLGLGGLLGVVMGIAGGSTEDLFSNTAVSASFAGWSIAVYLTVLPVMTWLWWRNVDEHEAGAYRDGAVVAVHGYLFAAPVWWMATRAGWAPPQDPMVMVVFVSLLWSAVWLYRRYF
jgi:hypothetical protein